MIITNFTIMSAKLYRNLIQIDIVNSSPIAAAHNNTSPISWCSMGWHFQLYR
jgi:hypothetical protein